MIGKLTGILDGVAADHLLVDVGGVGYVVHASARTLRRHATPGEAVSLLIEMQVREDALTLYGFAEGTERDWFRLLLTVQGVGAKLALAILGLLSPSELTAAIVAQDKAALTRTPGVGPKLAARIVAELKDKAGKHPVAAGQEGASVAVSGAAPVEDAVSALVNLGYRRTEAYGAVAKAAAQMPDVVSLNELIRNGLRELSGAGRDGGSR